MKKLAILFCGGLLIFVSAFSVHSQTANRPPDPSVVRNMEQERESMHNLEAARLYFRLRRAYIASLQRCEDVIASNPNFTRMDEVLYIAGVSNLRLSENRGRQRSTVAPATLRNEGRRYLSQLVNEYPDSSFRRRAEEELRTLGGAVRPESTRQ